MIREVGLHQDVSLDRLHRGYDAHVASLLKVAAALVGDRDQAEDLVHDAFLRWHRSGNPPPEAKVGAYLRVIVTNLAIDLHRHETVARRRAVAADDAPSAEDDVLAIERRRRVAAAVADLPERQRDCVVAHYFAGLTDAAVASDLGISKGAVKTHLHRARAHLARTLEDLR